MKTIQYFLRDESGMIVEWLVGLAGLLFLITAYVLFSPTLNILIFNLAENGSPLAQMLWVRTMFKWAFLIFGVLCIAYPFVASYRKTYDQGIVGWR